MVKVTYIKGIFETGSMVLFVISLISPALIFHRVCGHSRGSEEIWDGFAVLFNVPFGLLYGKGIVFATSANIFGAIALRQYHKGFYRYAVFFILVALAISIAGIMALPGLSYSGDEGGVCLGHYSRMSYGVGLWLAAQLLVLIGSILFAGASKRHAA